MLNDSSQTYDSPSNVINFIEEGTRDVLAICKLKVAWLIKNKGLS